MISRILMLAQDAPEIVVEEPAEPSMFGMWQILAVVGIIALIVGLKVYKNKTMS